ncbi:MAG: hypothetical protein WBN29_12060 [Polyangiales bacterium]
MTLPTRYVAVGALGIGGLDTFWTVQRIVWMLVLGTRGFDSGSLSRKSVFD